MTLDANALKCLRDFRTAALQVRNASVIASGATIQMSGSVGPEGIAIRYRLLAEEPFRSFAISVRLVYMEKEPGSFYRVCNIMHLDAPTETQNRIADCRARFTSILNGKYVQFKLHGPYEGQIVGPKEVFEAWLYGVVFHQDELQQALAEELGKYMDGYAFPYTVNLVGIQLAGVTLDLDDIVADHLGEPRVPRIAPSSAG